MRARFIPGYRGPATSRRDRVGNSGQAKRSRAREREREFLPPLEELLEEVRVPAALRRHLDLIQRRKG